MSARNQFWLCMIVLGLLILLTSCSAPLSTPTPEPTPMPEDGSTEAALEVVMDALGPIIESVAAQIDQGTVALSENTKSVHKSSEPTNGDTMIEALLICIIPICLILLTIAIFLFKDPRVARSVALFVGTWYHKREKVKESKVVNSSSPPASVALNERPDELDIG